MVWDAILGIKNLVPSVIMLGVFYFEVTICVQSLVTHA